MGATRLSQSGKGTPWRFLMRVGRLRAFLVDRQYANSVHKWAVNHGRTCVHECRVGRGLTPDGVSKCIGVQSPEPTCYSRAQSRVMDRGRGGEWRPHHSEQLPVICRRSRRDQLDAHHLGNRARLGQRPADLIRFTGESAERVAEETGFARPALPAGGALFGSALPTPASSPRIPLPRFRRRGLTGHLTTICRHLITAQHVVLAHATRVDQPGRMEVRSRSVHRIEDAAARFRPGIHCHRDTYPRSAD